MYSICLSKISLTAENGHVVSDSHMTVAKQTQIGFCCKNRECRVIFGRLIAGEEIPALLHLPPPDADNHVCAPDDKISKATQNWATHKQRPCSRGG